MEEESSALLVNALRERQGLSDDVAQGIVTTISSDPEVFVAALEWATTGIFPSHPVFEGESPKTLAHMKPSQVFTLLVLLHQDPEVGRSALAHPPPSGIEDLRNRIEVNSINEMHLDDALLQPGMTPEEYSRRIAARKARYEELIQKRDADNK